MVYSISGFDYDGTLLACTNRNIQPGTNVVRKSGGGDFRPTWAGVTSIDPKITLETEQIAAVLDILGMTGAAISSSALMTLYSRALANGGTFDSGSSHVKHVINEGLWTPMRLSAGLDGATLSSEVTPTYDGSNELVVVSSGQAFGGESTVSEAFIVGPGSINGTAVNYIQSLEVDFGLIMRLTKGSGDIRNTHAAIRKQQPVLTFTTTDTALAATIKVSGLAQGATDSVFYLRKIAENGNEVANLTAEHISFTLDDGVIAWMGSSGVDDEVNTYGFFPSYDGTNAIVALDTSVAIS